MGRRRPRASFMPDVYVFPGGGVDPEDAFAPADGFIKALGPACLARGALVRVQGHRMVLSPPLIFTAEAADQAFDALDGAIAAATAAA